MTVLTDNTLFSLIADTLDAASSLAGWGYLTVARDQPSPQGAVTSGVIYLERQFDDRYGWAAVSSQYNAPVSPAPQGTYTKSEAQWTQAHFQVSSMVIQNPSNLSIPTALDVTRYLAQYMNARSIVKALARQGAHVYRVSNIRNPWDKDDRDIFEATPSFELVVNYQSTLAFTVPATNIVTGETVQGNKNTGIFPV